MALQALDDVEVGIAGVPGDRRFALMDPAGRLVNGKRLGPLATIVPVVSPGGDRLALDFPDGSTVAGAVERTDRPTPCSSGDRAASTGSPARSMRRSATGPAHRSTSWS